MMKQEDEMELTHKFKDGVTVGELIKYLQQYKSTLRVWIPKASAGGACRGANMGRSPSTKGEICIR